MFALVWTILAAADGNSTFWQEWSNSGNSENKLFYILYIFTARKRSLGQGNIFSSMCQEFCPQGWWWWYPNMHCRWYPSMPCRWGGLVSQHALQVSRPTPNGEVEWSGLGGPPVPHPGGSPGPHLGGLQDHSRGGGSSRPTPGGWCIPACTETDLRQILFFS